MELGLKDKRALVMGSTAGMGEAIARTLTAEGARVAVTGRSTDKAEKIAGELDGAVAYTLDLADVDSVQKVIAAVEADFGGLDILVCNGGGPPPGPVADVDPDVWNEQFSIMFTNQLRFVSAFLPAMRERGWGRILSITSSGIQQPIPNLGISNSLRAAQVGWAKTLSAEVAPDGVTVNICEPGRIHTARVNQIDEAASARQGKDIEDMRAASRSTIPMGRYGDVQEFADTAVYLLSANASYVTGSVIRVDGGLIRSV